MQTCPKLLSKTKALTQELRRLEPKDIKKQLHVNDALAKEYAKHLGSFEASTPVPACSLYDSQIFNSLDLPSLDAEDAAFANTHIRVLSGLYGLVRPFDEIQPLSLPVNLGTKLTTSKGKFLRDYWKEPVQNELVETLQKLPAPIIINCALDEDSAEIFAEDVMPQGTRVFTVDMKTVNKEDAQDAKGEFIRWALEERCLTPEDLLNFKGLLEPGEPPSFRVAPKSSSPNVLAFEEAVGEGSGGGWGKKLAEFGGSKGKFIKEVASGRDRWKRAEINKALIKEGKQMRKKVVVC